MKMTLATFQALRAARSPAPERRPTCPRCWKSETTCYCHLLRPYDAPIEFVILQHMAEARNAIATARMAHLTLANSRLFMGHEFASDERVDALLHAPGRRNVMLYPRQDAAPLDVVLREHLAPSAEPLVLWVIDAKWGQVNKMLRLSPAVKALPATSFVPTAPSAFCVRTQPKAACLSTVEAIHAVLDRRAALADDGDRRHDAMLDVFRYLVRQQLGFCDWTAERRHAAAKRKRRERRASKSLETTT